MIDRTIVRRVLRLAEGARKVAGGDLTERIGATAGPSRKGSIWGYDEIDELDRDFDDMVEKIEHSLRELATANGLKQKFLSIAGHELRTPISAIAGRVKLVRDSDDPLRLREAIRSIGARAENLGRIVETMFKLLPEAALSQTLRDEEIEPAPFLEALREEVRPFLAQRRQALLVEAGDLPRFRADREKLLDVLENLLSNAIKFTPDEGTVRLAARIEDDRWVAFAISDQGEGIPADEMAHLFQPFFSGGELLQHSTGRSGYKKRGIGLGLAIVRYFTRLHGGTVEIQSGPKGSTFTVRIPAQLSPGLGPAAA